MGLNLDDLSSRVESDPWDSDAWYTLCSEAFRRNDLPFKLVDKHFQNALDKFPSSPQIWCLRLDSAVRASVSSLATNQVNENGSTSDASSTPDDDRVTQDTVLAMFKQATEASPTAVEVWRKYAAWAISHPEAADPVSIYEASIKAAGLEMTSTVLWNDYLSFLKQANWTESRRRDALRRFYKRAVRTWSRLAMHTRTRARATGSCLALSSQSTPIAPQHVNQSPRVLCLIFLFSFRKAWRRFCRT